jgi:hypothetical protein
VGDSKKAWELGVRKNIPVYGSMPKVQLGEVTVEHEVSRSVCKLVQTYRSNSDNLSWARKGVIATVLNGEALPVIQTRIAHAGFDDLDIIPLGADRVYIRCFSDSDAMKMIDEAREFFNLFFSQPTRWNKDIVNFQRGAWVRIYGIPIHAWNADFLSCLFQTVEDF